MGEIEVSNAGNNIGHRLKCRVETVLLEQETDEPLGTVICGRGPDKPGQ